WIASAIVTAFILACSPKPEPRTVDYYVNHKTERLQRLAECEDKAGTLKDDPDCINARQAAMKLWSIGPQRKFDMNQPSGMASEAAGAPSAPASAASR